MKQRRPLLIGLAVVAIVGAIWMALFLRNPPQQTLDRIQAESVEFIEMPDLLDLFQHKKI